MKAVEAIRRLGFRKWYERALMRSHGHLVLLLLSAVALMGGAEAFRRDLPASTQLMLAACGIASAAIGYWALRRYLFLLQNAEFLAAQAVCEQCKVYARWDITTEDRGSATMEVSCRRCGHRWKIAL